MTPWKMYLPLNLYCTWLATQMLVIWIQVHKRQHFSGRPTKVHCSYVFRMCDSLSWEKRMTWKIIWAGPCVDSRLLWQIFLFQQIAFIAFDLWRSFMTSDFMVGCVVSSTPLVNSKYCVAKQLIFNVQKGFFLPCKSFTFCLEIHILNSRNFCM